MFALKQARNTHTQQPKMRELIYCEQTHNIYTRDKQKYIYICTKKSCTSATDRTTCLPVELFFFLLKNMFARFGPIYERIYVSTCQCSFAFICQNKNEFHNPRTTTAGPRIDIFFLLKARAHI